MPETGSTLNGKGSTVIVCPTPKGGHIEHACDLALAIYKTSGASTIVLTRPGAIEYLPVAIRDYIEVMEVIPPLVGGKSGVRSVLRIFVQCWNLIVEHQRIRGVLATSGSEVLVLEEPRYLFPSLLVPSGTSARICLVIHNAVEHSQANVSLLSRAKDFISLRARAGANSIAVHGKRQLDLVAAETTTPVRSFRLPGSSYIHSLPSKNDVSLFARFPTLSETFVCMGELRANKGLEIAIEASRLSGQPLLILGKSVDENYTNALRILADDIDTIDFRPAFIEPAAFEYVLANCRAVLLPYSQFDAQSGVLARAVEKGTKVISSNLPSLYEQAAQAENVVFFETGSTSLLVREMLSTPCSGDRPPTAHSGTKFDDLSIPEWNNFARAIQTGW